MLKGVNISLRLALPKLSSLIFDVFLYLIQFLSVQKHLSYSLILQEHCFALFKAQPLTFFLVVNRKKVHVVVSVGPSLLFGSLLDAFSLLFLVPLSLIDRLISLVGSKSRFVV